jgi:DNA-binding XRE family transcriptional regulator
MKFLVKSHRDFKDGTPLMQDRIEYIRCILGFPTIKAFAKRLSGRTKALENIILNNSEGWLKPTADKIVEILGVDATWMLVGTGKPYYGDYSQYKYVDLENTYNIDRNDFGIPDRIRKLREEKNMTRPVFAASLSLSVDKIQKIEDRTTLPTVAVVNQIVKVYGVTDAWMLRGEGRQYPPKGR